MYNLAPQQQTDLKTWLEDTSQELAKSLENVLVKRCLEEIKFKTPEELQTIFKNAEIDFGSFSNCCVYYAKNNFHYIDQPQSTINFYSLNLACKTDFVQTLLSRTPDGQAVMPFLDVKVEAYKTLSYPAELKTLDHLLYREFTEALRVGKTFDEALQIITKIYDSNN